MGTIPLSRIPHLLALALLLCLPGRLLATDPPGPDDNTIIYLGKIGVTGKMTILQTLQAIKLSMKQPYSNDPRKADTVVCRLEDVPGNLTKQWLICGTNRVLSLQRNVLHSTMQSVTVHDQSTSKGSDGEQGPANSGCQSDACYSEVIGVLDETIQNQPGKFLKVMVNGSALRTLLDGLPIPAPDGATTMAPQAATSVAPAPATGHIQTL
jgi:hypothetical protein